VLKIDLIDTCLFIPAYKAGLSRQDSGKCLDNPAVLREAQIDLEIIPQFSHLFY